MARKRDLTPREERGFKTESDREFSCMLRGFLHDVHVCASAFDMPNAFVRKFVQKYVQKMP